MERVEVIEAYINSMHVDDIDGDYNAYRDDIIADHIKWCRL